MLSSSPGTCDGHWIRHTLVFLSSHPLGVTSRVIIDALLEQLGPLALPVLEGGDGRSCLQGRLR